VLELFSGKGVVADSARKLGCPALAFDLLSGDLFDLRNRAVRRAIYRWARLGLIGGVWFGTPCSSFSVARRPAVRSAERPWGLSGLPPHRQEVCKLGNELASITANFVRFLRPLGIPCALENPQSSLLWKLPPFKTLLSRLDCESSVCCQCSFGARWRKATRVAAWGASTHAFKQMCHSKTTICDFTLKPHIILSGNDPVSSKKWTALASSYPPRFGNAAASLLNKASQQQLDRAKIDIIM
jgi:hypothetical protein